MQVIHKTLKQLVYNGPLLILFFAFSICSQAQSTDVASPTPVSKNDLVGTIAARDLGDSRMTLHFYAFTGTPGDVLITVKSNNLNGDVDVFTAGTLRPLLKFTLYAESSLPSTKGIYLRRREELVLRVEARSPNDDEGSYEIRFGGSFEPVAAPLLAEKESVIEPAGPIAKKGRRVSSVGARIDDPTPPPEEVTVVTPEATPSPVPEKVAPEAPRTTTAGRGRGRGATSRRAPPRPAKETPAANKKEPDAADNKETEKPAAAAESEKRSTTAKRGTGRRGARPAVVTPVEPEPPSGPRLILELLDGTRVEQFMSTIRRVTIENNQIVVVQKTGKIDRTRMTDVVRMTIEP
ncbi:MAG: hypothetical protein ACR2LM_13665 [Pyrinomonadaceae bacterium]